ncbi:MAG: imidazole glycerol phosphate synthase subunit HisH [Gammaproteobacteria bacterium]|jgi:imidazole glycerol phosphate synthase glutamine amidotransferase subunit|nr:imidazole glycerol phosphate synthase subunit HisH [Gammaproteobacteria bacterium]|tara:strand:- start:317 stop:934 length:618 start_codon:yes stop_codon:yes gene_type:complete
MKVGVIDYGASNIFSVVRALNSLGASTKIVKTPEDFKNTDKLVFPGQGSMGACSKKLSENNLRDSLIDALNNFPFLGICLGLQILFSESEESEGEKGLNIFSEKIEKFSEFEDKTVKIPHMGWNQVEISQNHFLLKGIKSNENFYFVHSFASKEANQNEIFSKTFHGEIFNSAVGKDNIFATQFHPEKSGKSGLMILKNFLDWKI